MERNFKTVKKQNWNAEIKSVEDFLKNVQLPTEPIELNWFITIVNCEKFVKSHLEIVKANNGNNTYRNALDRLIEFTEILKTKN